MYDIMHKKLNINIKENVFFSDIEGYSIRIENKENDKLMHNIIIYDYTSTNSLIIIIISSLLIDISPYAVLTVIVVSSSEILSPFIDDPSFKLKMIPSPRDVIVPELASVIVLLSLSCIEISLYISSDLFLLPI